MSTYRNPSTYDDLPDDAKKILDDQIEYLFRMERGTIDELKLAIHVQLERETLDAREMWGLLTRTFVELHAQDPERLCSLLAILLIDTVFHERASN